jgi:hypothetical protein
MKAIQRLGLALLVSLGVGVLTAPGVAFTKQAAGMADPSIAELRALGTRLAAAVLSHDSEVILAADRPDLRADDRLALRNPKSDLYCFLFDSGCTTVKASVYEILSRARRLDIEVRLFRENSQTVQGWLLFFDATRVSKSRLRSASFLCQHVGEIASWMFNRKDGEWVSAHPPFDAETDTLCSPRQ